MTKLSNLQAIARGAMHDALQMLETAYDRLEDADDLEGSDLIDCVARLGTRVKRLGDMTDKFKSRIRDQGDGRYEGQHFVAVVATNVSQRFNSSAAKSADLAWYEKFCEPLSSTSVRFEAR